MNKEKLIEKINNYRNSLRQIDSDIGYLNQQVAMKRDLFLEISGRIKELEEMIKDIENEEVIEDKKKVSTKKEASIKDKK